MDYRFRAVVERWVDGDTVDLGVDLWQWSMFLPGFIGGAVELAPDGARFTELDLGFRLSLSMAIDSGSLAFSLRIHERFRLLGIDTPEVNPLATREAGNAATDFAEALAPVGSRVEVESSKSGKYGRWLGVVYVLDGAEREFFSVNEELLKSGHAVAYGSKS